MRKALVIGCPGSGKSAFATVLHQITKLPLYHLDMLYWQADGAKTPKEIFLQKLEQIMAKDAWIIDGDYHSSMDERMRMCDTIFFLDYDLDTCIQGIKSRKGKPRPDMPCQMPEDEDKEFMTCICDYNSARRPGVMQLLRKYSHKHTVIFHNRLEAKNYLAGLRQIKAFKQNLLP